MTRPLNPSVANLSFNAWATRNFLPGHRAAASLPRRNARG